jgi:hypothetical protein
MKILFLMLLWCAASLAHANASAAATTSIDDPRYLYIDPTEKYVTIYGAIDNKLSETDLRGMREKIAAQRPLAYIVEWRTFVTDQKKYIDTYIVKNEYPDIKMADGLIALLKKFQGDPFSVTWSGGLAVTKNDFTHSQRTYKSYLADTTFVARPKDRGADPIHPSNHIEPLLKQSVDNPK